MGGEHGLVAVLDLYSHQPSAEKSDPHVSVAALLNIRNRLLSFFLAREDQQETGKFSLLELVNPSFCTHPEGPVPIFVNDPGAEAGKSVAGSINDELAILQAIQAEIGGNPDAAVPSFDNRPDGIV